MKTTLIKSTCGWYVRDKREACVTCGSETRGTNDGGITPVCCRCWHNAPHSEPVYFCGIDWTPEHAEAR